jgi:hypothetical protein
MPIDDSKITVSGLTTTIKIFCTTPTSKWITVMNCTYLVPLHDGVEIMVPPPYTFGAFDEVEALDLFSYLLASLRDLLTMETA